MGISVIICCFNSSKRIGKVLEALDRQWFREITAHEIIVVDNVCADDTAKVARQLWDEMNNGIPLRIVVEQMPGLANARNKGIAAAKYEYIIFCDDDNWLFPDYLQGVADIFDTNSNVAACGGMGIPVFETEKPFWFDEYAECFATGSQEITREDGRLLNLYGAGMGLRKSSLDLLKAAKFNALMTGRTGKELSSSEDTELTYSLVLIGKELYFSPDMNFYHYMPGERLKISYLKKLFTAFGNDGPIRNLYYANVSKRPFHQKINSWGFHLLVSIVRMIKYLLKPPKTGGRIIYFNWNVAYIKSLFAIRGKYGELRKGITGLKDFTHKNVDASGFKITIAAPNRDKLS